MSCKQYLTLVQVMQRHVSAGTCPSNLMFFCRNLQNLAYDRLCPESSMYACQACRRVQVRAYEGPNFFVVYRPRGRHLEIDGFLKKS